MVTKTISLDQWVVDEIIKPHQLAGRNVSALVQEALIKLHMERKLKSVESAESWIESSNPFDYDKGREIIIYKKVCSVL